MVGTDELLALIRQFVAERWPGDPPDLVTIRRQSGRESSHSVPDVLPAPAAPEEPQAPQIEADVLDALEAAGKKLKREAIWRATRAAGKKHGQSTVYRHLAQMRRDGLLTLSPEDGYGLPEWEQ